MDRARRGNSRIALPDGQYDQRQSRDGSRLALDLRAKFAAAYTAEDIEQIGDGAVALLGLAQKLSDPQAQQFLEKMADLPSQVDLAGAKPVGLFGMLGALSSKEARQGLGVLMELTKAMGSLKNGGGPATDQAEPIA